MGSDAGGFAAGQPGVADAVVDISDAVVSGWDGSRYARTGLPSPVRRRVGREFGARR
jgi:hypothetical protein